MQKLSQTEELARTLAARARHHALTPEQISRAMDEQDYDVAQLDELYTALEDRGVHLTEEETDLPALDETQDVYKRQPSGWPDRQDRASQDLCCSGHLRCYPAHRWYAGLRVHHRCQQE